MRERGIARYQFIIWSARRRRRCLRFSDPTTVRSWCSTTTAICGVLRRGAATDLMGEVDDAPTARRIALVLGERPMWWSPEKDAGTKCRSVRSGAKRNAGCSSTAHLPHALVVAHPGGASRVYGAEKIRGTKARGDGEAVSKNLEKWQDGRLLRHLGGSCGRAATRLLRFLDGPKQQRSATHTYGPALGQQ